ncbi:SIR2 family protein [Niabella sp. CJ426]|uniref:SIR2 family protein n=1 Tax=Niabella sp. CJ426 TaxID=3393740 RepID=UPI003D029C00
MGQIENLQALRNKLANRKMSLLVGAGFSKNVSAKFPDWIQLLQDLVYELYEDEIESRLKKDLPEGERAQALRLQTQKMIEKVGYLKVVSEYISRKGYEEAIVTYIEKRTPIEKGNDGLYYLINDDDTRILLSDDMLNLHRTLLSFPWNNVFTTNYDPLLEASVDTNLHTKLMQENVALADRIHDLMQSLEQFTKKEQEINKRLNDLDTVLNQQDSSGALVEGTGPSEDFFKQREQLSNDLKELQNKIRQDKTEIHNKQQQYAVNEIQADSCYTLVTRGAELSLKKNKNIIKLHGSLRTIEERSRYQFGFDNDPRKQYIISAEHYEHYPYKHEAFTQLMRIALLQESFCLIGFSGVDPNFTAWISWVRDLLYRSGSLFDQQPDYKIYLVEMSDGDIKNDDRQLYYENHRIGKVSLLSPEVISFLEKETGQIIDKVNRYGSALKLLFDFLAGHDSISIPIKPRESVFEEQWQHLWDDVAKLDSDGFKFKDQKISESAAQIAAIASKITVPNLSQDSAYGQYRFLTLINNKFLSGLNVDSRNNLFKLFTHLVGKLYIPIGSVVEPEIVSELVAIDTLKEDATRLQEFDSILRKPFSDDPSSMLCSILRCAFTLDYDGLERSLNLWHPPIEQTHVKAGFLSQFNVEGAVELLEVQIASNLITEQQRIFSLELLRLIKFSNSWSSEDRLRNRIEQYKKAGYTSFFELIDLLVDSFGREKKDTHPYGRGRFSTSDSYANMNPFRKLPPFQFLSLIINFGFPLQIGILSTVQRETWYKFFKAGFEQFPFPFLYYAMQYRNENIQKRTAQDFAWSVKIKEHRNAIVKVTFNAFKSRPKSAMVFLTELFASVPPSQWQDDFAATWTTLVANGEAFEEYNTVCESYINAGLKFIEKGEIAFRIIIDILAKLQSNPDSVISYLYHLNSNRILKSKKIDQVPEAAKHEIDHIIDNLGNDPESALFTLGNIFFLLSEAQLNNIYLHLQDLDFEKLSNSRSLRVALFFSENDPCIMDKIRSAVLNHTELWATGIEGRKIHGGQQVLPIMEFSLRNNPKHGLTFSKEDLRQIYEKLKGALSEVQRVSPSKGNSIVDFTSIVHDMIRFLRFYKGDLEVHSDYTMTLTSVELLYAAHTGFSDFREGLSSSESTSVIWALAELSERLEFEVFEQQAVALILNKLLLQVGPSLEACLSYVSAWITDEKNLPSFANHSELLVWILKKYMTHPLPESDQPFVEEKLFKIAFALRQLGIDDQIISETLNPDNISFNNTRQWHALKGNELQN